MNKELKIIGDPMPDMPWEDRPEGYGKVMWRYSGNPVIPRDLLPDSNSIFNSAVVPLRTVLPIVRLKDCKTNSMPELQQDKI